MLREIVTMEGHLIDSDILRYLLPARVQTVCVDMAESLPLKLSNRGSMQAIGLVMDVGFFLERLEAELGTG